MAKRILFFVGGSYVSGVEIITLHLIKELKRKGCNVHCVISGWNDGVFKQKLNALGVSFDEVKLGWIYWRKPLWTLNTLINYPGALMTSRKVLKRFKPDVCHFCYYGVVVMLYPILKSNCVFGLHDPELPTRKNNFIYKIVNRKAKFFTGVSMYIVGALKNLSIPTDKIRLVYNGIPLMQPSAGQELLQDVTVFAIIGQIVPWKGHETLLDAAALLVRMGTRNFKIYIYGNNKNEYTKTLQGLIDEKQLEEYIVWKGFVTDQNKIYQDVNIVVVPSLSQEPCSISIIESMMFRKAVVVSDRGGNVELVKHNTTGLVFAAGDASELSNHMLSLLNDRALMNNLANAAYEKASVDLTVERMGNEYEKLYEDIIKLN